MVLNRKTLACALLALSVSAGTAADGLNPALWSGMQYRMIGPNRGGRVTAVTGVPSQPATFYMGSTGGGVWKTTDAGYNWINLSDHQIPVASMGAIEVSLSNPGVVYAGTGSSKIRSNVSIGRGIYKSTDAGKTWVFAGLRDVGQISTVRVHPTNPDMVWVAALGNPFADNPERGIYRTTDGGRNWQRVLGIFPTVPGPPMSNSSPVPRMCSSPACGVASASRGPSSAARAKAEFIKARIAASPGPSLRAACPTNSSGAATSPSPPRCRTESTR